MLVVLLSLVVLVNGAVLVAGYSPPLPTTSIKAAYWPSWSNATFPVTAIDTSHFTHLYYAFLLPDPSSHKLAISDSDHLLLSRFNSHLHTHNPPNRPTTLLSIGGGGIDSTLFPNMSSDPTRRLIFIKSVIETARKYDFNGVDLDWEFPRNPKEMSDLGQLLLELKVEVNREAAAMAATPLLLSAAVYFTASMIFDPANQSYPTKVISQNVDWVNVMCYDYYGSWDTTTTGAHAALYNPINTRLSTSYGLRSWARAGVPTRKLVMGLPLFAHTWRLAHPEAHEVGAPAVGVGPGGESGILTFAEVEEFNRRERARVVYDNVTVSAYSYVGEWWLGYDNTASVRKKIKFARGMGLRGYFFWDVSGDKKWKISKQGVFSNLFVLYLITILPFIN